MLGSVTRVGQLSSVLNCDVLLVMLDGQSARWLQFNSDSRPENVSPKPKLLTISYSQPNPRMTEANINSIIAHLGI